MLRPGATLATLTIALAALVSVHTPPAFGQRALAATEARTTETEHSAQEADPSTPPASPAPSGLPPFEPVNTSSASPPPDDSSASPAEDDAATRALGSDSSDVPDPIADEGERTGSAEGEPIPQRADVADEIAALSDRACLRALQRARVPFERVHHNIPGIGLPIRVVGPIAGVRYRASERLEVHELMDCRLAVALVRFSRMLRHLGIRDVAHYSTYRAAGSRDVGRRDPVQARHAGGMAIDAAWFIRDDGVRFNVQRDFHGRLGRVVCGPEARVPHDMGARLLRTIACDAARRGLFTVILTPNFNYAHRNHFHLEVTRNANWRSVD
jgi:hypothetical protein